ncbi:MAG: IPT/TIG domain-containing protein [Planctomycetes bacterium]|nr:IPT/TIG domain-containing protein [Planctomycetota bacterium]
MFRSLLPLLFAAVLFAVLVGSSSLRADLLPNGAFEADPPGVTWTEWGAPWGAGYVYNYQDDVDPGEGIFSLALSASSGSFGVYYNICVEPGVPVNVSWRWRGLQSGANGWFEVLLLDQAWDINVGDGPQPEDLMEKWEFGFGGTFLPPEEEWTDGAGSRTPTGGVMCLVLKCGTTTGPVNAWFDAVVVTQGAEPSIESIEPSEGAVDGGETVTVVGCGFTTDAVVTIGGKNLVDPSLDSDPVTGAARITGTTPAGAAGPADVTVTTSHGTATFAGGFVYKGGDVLFIRGDADGSGGFTVGDAIQILERLFSGRTALDSNCEDTGDLDDTGVFTIGDAVYLLSYLFADGPEPPAPFPGCGADPTPETSLGCEAYPVGNCP